MARFFGFLILFFGLLMVYAVYSDLVPFWTGDRDKMIYVLWKQDIEKLSMFQRIPRPWGEIKEVEYIPQSASTKILLTKIKAPIHTETKGKYKLQIKLDDFNDQGNYTLLVQYHLVELESGNTIWELDRDITLPAKTVSQNRSGSNPPLPASSPSGSPEPQQAH